jgi:hypothetical protein
VVQLRGTVTDPEHALTSVQLGFSGAAAGSTNADQAGNFSLLTSNADLGTVHATASDGLETSPERMTNITDAAPVLTLDIAYEHQTTVTLSGSVADIDKAGLQVTLTGMVSTTVVTDSDGNFSVTTQASGLGPVTASTVDLWGVASNQPFVNVYSRAPQITSFSASRGLSNLCTLYGTVDDEDPAGLRVDFGGLPSVSGLPAIVGADGRFSTTIRLNPEDHGRVTAQTTDWWGLRSDIDWTDLAAAEINLTQAQRT